MVTVTPNNKEVNGLETDNSLDDEEFTFKSNNDNNKEKLLALLYFYRLFELYQKYKDKSPDYILKNFSSDIDKLTETAKGSLKKDLEAFKDSLREEQLVEYDIPIDSSYGDTDIEPSYEVILYTLLSAHEQLKYDVQMKAKVWNDQNKLIKEFNINSNFKRILGRYNQAFNYVSGVLRQKSDRNIKSFVYTPETKYIWVCYGNHPCAWCLDQQALPPRLLKEIPFDHINGYCGLEVADGFEYSVEYQKLMGWLI